MNARADRGLADVKSIRGTDEVARCNDREEGSGQFGVHWHVPLISIVQISSLNIIRLLKLRGTYAGFGYQPIPDLSQPRPLRLIGKPVLALTPDISLIAWIPQVDATRIQEVLTALSSAGRPPRLYGLDLQALEVTDARRTFRK
jgi:hypothetical protein